MSRQAHQPLTFRPFDSDCAWISSTPSAERVWRALDTSEALFATFNAAGAFLTAQALEVHGPLTEGLLVQALAHIEKRHPLLRARIVTRGGSPCWVEGARIFPHVSVIDQVPTGGLKEIAEAELHRTFTESSERLWRCTWIPVNRDRHWIVVALHHALADGISGMVTVRDLIATCSALMGRGKLPPELAPGRTLDEVLPPVSPLAWLHHRAARLRSRLLGPPPILPMEQTAPPGQRRTGVIFGSVPGDVMLGLRLAARGRGATISGALAAALLQSVRQTLGALPLVPVTYSVSMRGSTIPWTQVGCFSANVVTRHPLRARGSFWRDAQSATDQLHRALDRGDAAAAVAATRGKVSLTAAAVRAAIDNPRTAGRVGAINISNRGVVGDFSSGPFKVAAWYPATSNHTYGNGIQLSGATVGNTFFFGLMHVVPLLGAERAQHITDRFVDALSRAAHG